MSTINFRKFGPPSTARLLAGALTLGAFLAAGPPEAQASLADWGIVVGDNNDTSYNGVVLSGGPTTHHGGDIYGRYAVGTTTAAFTYQYMIEDYNDNSGVGGTVGPNQGGQNYDAEFIGVAVVGGELKIAILTGQMPAGPGANPASEFSPGDIRIETTTPDVFGIEVGGGGTDGKTWAIHPTNGSTTGSSTHSTGQVAGSLWKNSDWIYETVAPNSTPVQIKNGTGTNTGNASSFSYTAVSAQHAFIELTISLAGFGGSTLTQFSWAPSCGNDIVFILGEGITTNIVVVPEPSSMCLLAMAGFGFLAARPRRRKVA
jgi:hypothetical protein